MGSILSVTTFFLEMNVNKNDFFQVSDQREIKKHNFLLHEKSLAELSAVLTSYIN